MRSSPVQRHPLRLPGSRSTIRTWLAGLFFTLWLALLASGFYTLAKYDTTPGDAHAAPPSWPTASALRPSPHGWNLVIFLHPQCPCSRASLDELNVIMNSDQARDLSAHVVFLKPSDRTEDWVHTYSWEKAGTIRHASRWLDADGVETARFKAETSGFLLLYDAAGRLKFSGGITGARGEDGDNLGREAVLQLLAGKASAPSTHAVFGCSLVVLPHPATPLAENDRP